MSANSNHLLLRANLKQLKLPTMQSEFEKLAREAAAAGEGHEQYLLRLSEPELAARSAKAYPVTNTDWDVTVLDTRSAMTNADTWTILGLMGVVVFFVLLIACASLANLARARLIGRRIDLAVRQAMGASRLQLIRPLVSESIVLGVIGGLEVEFR